MAKRPTRIELLHQLIAAVQRAGSDRFDEKGRQTVVDLYENYERNPQARVDAFTAHVAGLTEEAVNNPTAELLHAMTAVRIATDAYLLSVDPKLVPVSDGADFTIIANTKPTGSLSRDVLSLANAEVIEARDRLESISLSDGSPVLAAVAVGLRGDSEFQPFHPNISRVGVQSVAAVRSRPRKLGPAMSAVVGMVATGVVTAVGLATPKVATPEPRVESAVLALQSIQGVNLQSSVGYAGKSVVFRVQPADPNQPYPRFGALRVSAKQGAEVLAQSGPIPVTERETELVADCAVLSNGTTSLEALGPDGREVVGDLQKLKFDWDPDLGVCSVDSLGPGVAPALRSTTAARDGASERAQSSSVISQMVRLDTPGMAGVVTELVLASGQDPKIVVRPAGDSFSPLLYEVRLETSQGGPVATRGVSIPDSGRERSEPVEFPLACPDNLDLRLAFKSSSGDVQFSETFALARQGPNCAVVKAAPTQVFGPPR